MQKLFFSLIFVLANFSAHAALRCEDLWFDQRLRSDEIKNIPASNSGSGFIVPNELFLGNQKDVMAQFSEGIYLTVGTERGLMSSALAKGKVKALIQVDLDPKVVLFNRINRALLAGSENREHYLQLRLSSTHADWLALLHRSESLSSEDRQTLSRQEAWWWWREKVQHLSDWKKFHQNPKLNADQAYLDANYLFDDALYANVAELAKQNRIFVIHDSLGKETFKWRVDGIVEALKIKLSVVDLSNAWQDGYLGHENTIKFLESLKPQMKSETRFVFTYMASPNSQTNTSSVFKYLFTGLSQHFQLSELAVVMANMARVDPSKVNNSRSRVNRYDDF